MHQIAEENMRGASDARDAGARDVGVRGDDARGDVRGDVRSGPPKRFDVALTVMVEGRTADWLREYADEKGVTVAQAHRWALDRGIGALQAEWSLEIERETGTSRI